MRRTTLILGLVLLSVVLLPGLGEARAGDILTLTYEHDNVVHLAEDFGLPEYLTYGAFSFPQFDPSLGYLMQITGTAKIVHAQYSGVEADNEENPHYGGQAYQEYFTAGGFFELRLTKVPHPSQAAGFSINGGTSSKYLEADNELGGGAADFMGTDYGSYWAGPTYNLSGSSSVVPEVPIEYAADDPYIGHYVGTGSVDVDYRVESCIIAYVTRCEKKYHFGDVTVDATLQYTYEVPEPATLSLLAVGVFAVIRRKRR